VVDVDVAAVPASKVRKRVAPEAYPDWRRGAGGVPAPVSFNYLEAFQGRLLQVGLYPWHLTEFVELGLGELTRHMLGLGRGVEVEGKVTHGVDEERGEENRG